MRDPCVPGVIREELNIETDIRRDLTTPHYVILDF